MIKIGLLGSGKLAKIIAKGIMDGKVPGCCLAGILGRTFENTVSLAKECGCTPCASIDELLALEPEYIVEAATAEALKDCVVPCLKQRCNIICLSVGALCDDDFRNTVEETARENNAKLYIANGVIGGLDLAASAAMSGPMEGTLIKYHFGSVNGKPGIFPDHYHGSCREAFEMCPQHLNIAIAAGIACGDLDRTKMGLDLVPAGELPGIKFVLEGTFGKASIVCERKESGPILAAWSALATLKRAISPITF